MQALNIRKNFNLAKITWFGVGGDAEFFYKPSSVEELSEFLANNNNADNVFPLGVASNLLVRDGGIDGYVIKLGKEFSQININGCQVKIGAAQLDSNCARFLAEKGLSGLEFLIGIPGTIGGNIAMNAGCYGNEISDKLIFITALHKKTGKLYKFEKKDINFAYRKNPLRDEFIFLDACFELCYEMPQKIHEKINEITQKREATQPIRSKTGGSSFKNPNGYSAWKLIDDCGLRGRILGGAMVSEKHCNFLINNGNAKASDIEKLGELIRNEVYNKKNIMLDWEIIRIGKNNE